MAVYLSEEALREEIIKLQATKKLKDLVAKENKSNCEFLAIEELKNQGIDINYNKEKFGQMIMLIINKILTRPNFSGYSWKDDFTSNAVEKILSYCINNFNPDGISRRSGQKFKAFAYITEITMRACWEVINNKNEEQRIVNEYLVPLDSFNSLINKVVTESKIKDVETHEKFFELTYDDVLKDQLSNTYTSLYDLVKKHKDSKLKIVYPTEYFLDMEEYNKINSLNVSYLNLHKIEPEKYIPQMPKKQKKVVINNMTDWF